MPFDLTQVRKVFYHQNCPDGTTAALICAAAFRAIQQPVKFYSIQYSTDFFKNLRPEPGHLFVDITPPPDSWEKWRDVAPIVLDHHESVQHITNGLGGVYGDENESGATLAFKHVMMPLSISVHGVNLEHWCRIASLSMIRDTWKRDNIGWNDSQQLAHGIDFYGVKELFTLLEQDKLNFEEVMSVGALQLKRVMGKSKRMAEGATIFTVEGQIPVVVALFNCTEKIYSEVGHILLDQGADIAIGYFYLRDGGFTCCVMSVRTAEAVSKKTDGKLDAKQFVLQFKGGGHQHSAGCQIDKAHEYSESAMIKDVTRAVQSLL